MRLPLLRLIRYYKTHSTLHDKNLLNICFQKKIDTKKKSDNTKPPVTLKNSDNIKNSFISPTEIKCKFCNGFKIIKCLECNGCGKIYFDGMREFLCNNCRGAGSTNCTFCGGLGSCQLAGL
jgi:hypothetical protein